MSKNTGNYEHFFNLKDYNIPVVFFDRVPPVEETYSVSCSLKNSTVTMVDMLVQKGHKRIGFIRGPEQASISRERMDGFREGLKKHGIAEEKELIVQTDLTTGSTEKAIEQVLSLQNAPTAIIAFNDYVALDAIRYAKKKGFKINKDLYFASYANLPITHYLDNPPFVSVEQFPYQQAEKATEMLLSILNKKATEELSMPRHVVLEGKVVVNNEW
jgi:LacI family transcriptional regulator